MKLIRRVSQSEVFSHWEKVEKISIGQRIDIVFPLVAYSDIEWSLAKLEEIDIDRIYIISSDDWKSEDLCLPDFKFTTALKNYREQTIQTGKYADIRAKEEVYSSNPSVLNTKLIFVSADFMGPYTIIEGNKRAIALGNLRRLNNLEVYIGISKAIGGYVWSRYAK